MKQEKEIKFYTEKGEPASLAAVLQQANAVNIKIGITLPDHIDAVTDRVGINANGDCADYFRFRPKGSKVNGTIIHIPGTANTIAYPKGTFAFCANMAAKLNVQVITFFPRLTHKNRYPTPIIDLSYGINNMLNNLSQFSIDDPNKIALSGYSSGGLWAILACMESLRREGALPFAQLILFTPGTDWSLEPNRKFDGPPAHAVTPEFHAAAANHFLPPGLDAKSGLVSPRYADYIHFIGFPETILIFGAPEYLANDTREFYKVLLKAGVVVHKQELLENHFFPWQQTYYLDEKLKQQIKYSFDHAKPNTKARLAILPRKNCDSLLISPVFDDIKHVPRVRVMKAISDYFSSSSNNQRRSLFAICGMGGVGKSQAALYYYNMHGCYKYRIWFKASDEQSLLFQYKQLALSLRMAVHNDKDEVSVLRVKTWLEHQGNYLLVFDDAENYKMLLPFLPNAGHIIVTSRNKNWQNYSVLNEMVEDQALQLAHNYLAVYNKHDQENAKILIQRLARLPLAITQACAYINHHVKSIAEYIEQYDLNAAMLLSSEAGREGEDHPCVWVTMSMAFKKLVNEHPASIRLIHMLSFLAPECVPIEIFAKLAEGVLDEYKKLAVILDKQYSIISVSYFNDKCHTTSMHALVQNVARQHCIDQGQSIAVVSALLSCLVEQSEAKTLSSHLQSLLKNIEKHKLLASLDTKQLVNAYSKLSEIQSHPKSALIYAKRAALLAEACTYKEKITAQEALRNAYWISGNVPACLKAAGNVLETWLAAGKQHDYDYARAQHNLGLSYKRLGLLSRADDLFVQAQHTFINIVYSCKEPRIKATYAFCVSIIISGYVYIDLKDTNAAIESVNQAQDLLQSFPGQSMTKEQHDIVVSLSIDCKGKAWLFDWDGTGNKASLAKAKPLLLESLAMRKRMYGEKDRLVAEVYTPLARTCDQLIDSVSYLKKAFNIFYSLHLNNNFFLADAYWIAGDALLLHNELEVAHLLYGQSLAIFKNEIHEDYYLNHPKIQHIFAKLNREINYKEIAEPIPISEFRLTYLSSLNKLISNYSNNHGLFVSTKSLQKPKKTPPAPRAGL